MPDRYLGRIIGKYRVARHLGTGAFSWVYEAVDLDLEIPVALKILRPEFAGEDAVASRFRKEAATAARLRHPNIVTVRDVGQTDGVPFVVMDLYPLTLGRRLALVGHLPESEVVRLGIGIAAALAVAHANQIIHRDIKPDNILLAASGDGVVADFGLAQALAGQEILGTTAQVQGTPHYFSPEQARGKALDGRSDLYSLGVTLYRAATGRLPFEGEDWYAVATQHVEVPPPGPRTVRPELTPEFEAVLLRLLAKAPSARYADAMQLIDALAALPSAPVGSDAVARYGATTVDVVRASGRPAKRVLWATVLVVAGALLAWLARPRAPRPTVSVPAITSPAPESIAAPDPAPETPPSRPTLPDNATGTPRPPVPPRRGAIFPRAVRLHVTTADSAAIYVDNRLVGAGAWSGELPLTTRLVVRAVIPDAPTSCRSALHDTVITDLVAGRRFDVHLPVRGCSVVRYRVEPRDARVQFVPLDGGRPVETRADSVESYSLPWGRYLMRISAPYCIVFSDTVVVSRVPMPTTVPRKLVCS